MQAAKERTHAETTRREFFKLKIILIFLHHIQIIVTRIFNRIRKVTHMTRDIHDIILHPSDSVLIPTLSLNMNPSLVIPAKFVESRNCKFINSHFWHEKKKKHPSQLFEYMAVFICEGVGRSYWIKSVELKILLSIYKFS